MSFLNQEKNNRGWKSIFKSREFKQSAFVIILCMLFLAVGFVVVSKMDKLFPQTAQAQSNQSEEEKLPLKVSLEEDQNITPTLNPVIHPATVSSSAYSGFRLAIGRLDKVEDHTKLIQDEPYNNLLLAVSKLTAEELSKKVNHKIKFKDLMSNPEKYRGVPVRLEGLLLVGPQVFDYPETSPSGIPRYYSGTIVNLNDDSYARFHIVERPEKFDPYTNSLRYADMVWIEGAFLKLEKYEVTDKAGGGYRSAPFIIGKLMGKVIPSTKGITQFRWFMAGIIIVISLVAIIFIFLSGKKEKLYRQGKMEKMKKKAAEIKKQTSPHEESKNK